VPTVLSVRHLTKRYGTKLVLNDISFDVEDGEFFVVYGPSGVGKTTLLNLISGLTEADSGEIWLDNRRIDYLDPDQRNIAMTFQSYALYPQWTAFDNIASPLRSKHARVPKELVTERVESVARKVGIDHVLDHRPGQLSGGQKQRVGLARSIVRPSRLLLLDSPLAHVDTQVRHEMRGELKRLTQETQSTILYVTHDYMEALGLGDRIAVLKDGIILQVGRPRQIYQEPVNLWIARNVGQPEINIFPARLEGSHVLVGGRYSLPLPPPIRQRLPNEQEAGEPLLGVRPEDFVIQPEGELKGHIRLCQWLGTRTILNIAVDGLPEVVVAYWGFVSLPPDTEVGLSIRWERAMWFRKDSGENIFTTRGGPTNL
jgi:multiple sugar transport system ATP-binding protein